MKPHLVLLAALITLTGPVHAATCHDKAISARGEPSKFLWIAKTKARANWRREVRATTGLGTEWAVWAQASDTEERCLSGPEGTLCIFTGTPCKP
ncbi:MAG: hypothetical protein ABL894_06070 [Hyphomicrobium sp.]